jgi:hypothetical protein
MPVVDTRSGLLKAGTILLLVGAIPCKVSPEGEAHRPVPPVPSPAWR